MSELVTPVTDEEVEKALVGDSADAPAEGVESVETEEEAPQES